jgi:7-keto-8-aminopelargonate synthetase-like enzyme
MALAAALLQRGIFAQGIRPPTVPEGTSRLRVTPMATHSREQLAQALEAFAAAGKELGILA